MVTFFLKMLEQTCFHSVKSFQVLQFKPNIHINYQSFAHKIKWFQVLLFKPNIHINYQSIINRALSMG